MRLVMCALVVSLGLWGVLGCDEGSTQKAKDAAGAAAKSATDEVTKQVNSVTQEFPQVGDIVAKLKENKTEAADKALAALEAAKATLPAKLQEMLPKLRGVVDKVKGGTKFDMSMLSGLR